MNKNLKNDSARTRITKENAREYQRRGVEAKKRNKTIVDSFFAMSGISLTDKQKKEFIKKMPQLKNLKDLTLQDVIASNIVMQATVGGYLKGQSLYIKAFDAFSKYKNTNDEWGSV